MILKCPKCHSDNCQIERRIDGDITCTNCNTKGKHAHFNFRTQHLEKIYELISQLAEKDLRIGQIFNIIHNFLLSEGKDSFYIENDEFLTKLKELIK